MATNNSVNVGLSGESGTGNFSGTISPFFTTPTIGAATATSITFSPTTSGIVGTTTNDNAAAGKVGEFISSTILEAAKIGLSNNTDADVTSIALTAGDWDVFGSVSVETTIGAAQIEMWISLTSATRPDFALHTGITPVTITLQNYEAMCPPLRVSIAGNTTVYLSARAVFGAGTASACGYIQARRFR